MINYKYIGETYKFPTNLNEITTRQFIEFYPILMSFIRDKYENNEFNLTDFYSTILGIDFDVIYNMPIKVSKQLEPLTKLININEIINLMPTKIDINHKKGLKKKKTTIKLYNNWKKYNFCLGQMEYANSIVKGIEGRLKNKEIEKILMKVYHEHDLEKDELRMYEDYFLNVFVQSMKECHVFAAIILTGSMCKFNHENVMDLSKKLLEYPFNQIAPIGFFLLSHIGTSLMIAITGYLMLSSKDFVKRQKYI